MKAYWTDKRPNGATIDAGTFARVIDLEDGTHPVWTYGRTMEEVLEKIERQNGNAQLAMARRSSPQAQPQTGPGAGTPAPETRFRLSADEVMQYTADMQNPAKIGKAIVMLQAHETGVDPQKLRLDKFKAMAFEWEREHPEFYAHYANRKVLGDYLGQQVQGEVERVTKEMMTHAYQTLTARGLLFEPAEEIVPAAGTPTTQPTPSPFPVESQVQQTERPRRMFTTGARTATFGASQRTSAQPRTLKYTFEQIRTMPLEESERLARAKDADYMAAAEHYYGQRTA